MIEQSAIDRLKDDIDLRSYIAYDLGHGEKATSGDVYWFKCPFHSGGNERTASLAVYHDHFHCFSAACSAHGDVIEYVQRRTGKDFRAAYEMLSGDESLPQYKRTEPISETPRKKTVLSLDQFRSYHFDLGRVQPYLNERNIDPAVIERNMIGATVHRHQYVDVTGKIWKFECNRVSMPYLWGGEAISQNFRRDDRSALDNLTAVGKRVDVDMFRLMQIDLAEKWGVEDPDEITREQVLLHAFGSRFYKPQGTPAAPYGIDYIMRKEGTAVRYMYRPMVLLTEGEFNRLSCESAGFPAIALKPEGKIDVVRLLQNVRTIYVCIDSDEAGMKYGNKVLSRFGGDKSRIRFIVMPEGYNDPNDLHKQGKLRDFLMSPLYGLEPVLL